jgi:hypothetical protein
MGILGCNEGMRDVSSFWTGKFPWFDKSFYRVFFNILPREFRSMFFKNYNNLQRGCAKIAPPDCIIIIVKVRKARLQAASLSSWMREKHASRLHHYHCEFAGSTPRSTSLLPRRREKPSLGTSRIYVHQGWQGRGQVFGIFIMGDGFSQCL